MSRKRRLRSVELFTGAGGLALGIHAAGFKNLGLVEYNTDACDTLRHNVSQRTVPGISSWKIHQEDVRRTRFAEFEGIDLVAGGPPCQPFSIGGKHRGMDDGRNLFPEFIRAVRECRPQAFIIENVKGLTRKTFVPFFSYVILQLTYPGLELKDGEGWLAHLDRLEKIHTKGKHKGIHYNVVYRVLNAADYGVPQTRHRIFIVGFREDLGIEWHFPVPTHSFEVLLHDQYVTRNYWERHRLRPPPVSRHDSSRIARLSDHRIAAMKPWRTVRDAIADLPNPEKSNGHAVLNHDFQPGARAYKGHSGSYVDLPAKTLKAGDHGVPGGENMVVLENGSVRYFTVREASRVQTFPDEWFVSGAWTEAMRQLGNAVPPKLAQVVADSVANKLNAANG